jgi:hypothetical protein
VLQRMELRKVEVGTSIKIDEDILVVVEMSE